MNEMKLGVGGIAARGTIQLISGVLVGMGYGDADLWMGLGGAAVYAGTLIWSYLSRRKLAAGL